MIREACVAEGGVEVDTQGDAFFFAFPTAPGAIAAAEAMTTALAQGSIQVRIGLHTGTPLLTNEGYIGGDVHRAARIAAAGHGGQVLVSSTTAPLAELELHDLGEHRFKDLSAPERVYQLGRRDFPPLKSLYRSNLPVPLTTFLGREQEMAVVTELLRREGVRLVTLTGPGGTGKTRLALQATAEVSELFPDGLFWVPLSPLRDPALVLLTAAAAMEIKEQAGESALESLGAALAGRQVVLLLDNAEHLLPALATDVTSLLAAAPTVKLVVTSRERLRVEGEHVYPVPTLAEADGVRLFLDRARALNPSFSTTGEMQELCERLDHLPLALELAAARTGLLSAEQLLERLGGRLDVLRGARDVDPRQQTLRATIEWSYDLLSAQEREVFARMSVFAGGCTLEAAESVCDTDVDVLQALLDKSLVRRRETEREPRLWMLETIRDFAAERLAASGGADDLARRHLEYYLALAQEVAEQSEDADHDRDRLDHERDNLRIALDMALATDPDMALELAGRLREFWAGRGLHEGREKLAAALAAAPDAPAAVRARGLRASATIAMKQADLEAADRFAHEALALHRELHDPRGAGSDLNLLGILAWYRGDLTEASRLLEEAVEEHRESGSESGRAIALANLASVAQARGEHHRAIELTRENLAIARGRSDTFAVVLALNSLGLALEATGETEDARQAFEENISLTRAHDMVWELAYTLAGLGHLEQAARPRDALAHYRESISLMREMGDQRGLAYCLEGLAALTVLEGGATRASTLLGAATAIRERTSAVLTADEQAEVETTISQAGEALSVNAFGAAWSAGSGMSVDQAVEFALSVTTGARD